MELKFRAWDEAKQEYIYSDKIAGGMWRYFKTLEDRGIRHFMSEQYIGLPDKNGTDIYFNDIVKCHEKARYARQLSTFNTRITFKKGMFTLERIPNGWNELYLSILYSKVEIIGNVNANPELLEVK